MKRKKKIYEENTEENETGKRERGKKIRNIGDKMDILEKIGKGGEIH